MSATTWARTPIRWDRDLALDRDMPVHKLWAQLRTELGMTTGEVAAIVGVTRQAVSAWESGARQPSPGNVKKMLALYRQVRAEEPTHEDAL